jgi:putative transposase
MLLCKKIKLEVSEQDVATLEFMQGKCRGLYNWWVMKLRDGEKWPGVYEAKKTLQQSRQHDPELKWVYTKLLHEVYFRLGGAMDAFFRRVQNGEKPGFPRVRPRHCFFTLCYPAMYIKVEGNRVILPTGGKGKNKQAMPLYKRTYRCTNCGLVLDRDENSAHNILARFLARRGPYTGDPVRCADVFTATEYM